MSERLARYRELRACFPPALDGSDDEEAQGACALYQETEALLAALAPAERALLGPRLVIADVDGTWVEPAGGSEFARDEYDWRLLPGRAATLRWLRLHRIKLALASNQGGVAFGYRSYEQALTYVHRIGWRLHAHPVHVCPHHPAGTLARYRRECYYRKPGPGMLLAILHEADVAAPDALYIGDRPEDEGAAQAAGLRFCWADDYFRAPWLGHEAGGDRRGAGAVSAMGQEHEQRDAALAEVAIRNVELYNQNGQLLRDNKRLRARLAALEEAAACQGAGGRGQAPEEAGDGERIDP